MSVAPVLESGTDIDAGALVSAAVRRAVARAPATDLVDPDFAQSRLEVELIGASARLAPLAEPGRRAAQYLAVVRLRGRLVDLDGDVLWASPVVAGEAPFLSAAGRIEALDGARRRALKQAAEQAADRLIAGMNVRLGT